MPKVRFLVNFQEHRKGDEVEMKQAEADKCINFFEVCELTSKKKQVDNAPKNKAL